MSAVLCCCFANWLVIFPYLWDRYSNNFAGECDWRAFCDSKVLKSFVKDGSDTLARGDLIVLDFIIRLINGGTFQAEFYFIHQSLLKAGNFVFLSKWQTYFNFYG